MNREEWTVLERFRGPQEARLAQGLLEPEGIVSRVEDEQMGGWFQAVGGVRLLVRAADLERARELLGSSASEGPDAA